MSSEHGALKGARTDAAGSPRGVATVAEDDRPGAIATTALVCAGLWSLAVAPFIGNLHTDTLEAIYWGSDWALGYGKHPPVVTWLLFAVLQLGAPPIFSVLVLSQATVLLAAYFVWRTVRLFQGPSTATVAVCLYLVSPAATLFAVQANHDSMLAPFWAASMFFGLRYLEERRVADSVALGFSAGLGGLTKYEIAFVLATLIAAALMIPRYRRALRKPSAYVSVAIFAAILAPHVWWLAHNHWESVERAVGAQKVTTFATAALSAGGAIDGLFVLFVGPTLLFALARRLRFARARSPQSTQLRLGLLLTLGPSAALLIGAVLTDQLVKPLWSLPLASSVAAGLVLVAPVDELKDGVAVRARRAALILSAATYVGFFAYLLGLDALGRPLTAYDFDGQVLASAVKQEWAARHLGPPACLVIADRKIGPSPELWIHPLPHFVDYSSPFWHGPKKLEDCLKTGAVIVDATPDRQALKSFPRVCPGLRAIRAPSFFDLRKTAWPVELAYAAPAGEPCPPA